MRGSGTCVGSSGTIVTSGLSPPVITAPSLSGLLMITNPIKRINTRAISPEAIIIFCVYYYYYLLNCCLNFSFLPPHKLKILLSYIIQLLIILQLTELVQINKILQVASLNKRLATWSYHL